MSDTTKSLSERDGMQVLQHSYNPVNGTIGTDGFVVGKVGRKITLTAFDAVTDDYEFFEGATSLYKIRVIFTDASHTTLASVERLT